MSVMFSLVLAIFQNANAVYFAVQWDVATGEFHLYPRHFAGHCYFSLIAASDGSMLSLCSLCLTRQHLCHLPSFLLFIPLGGSEGGGFRGSLLNFWRQLLEITTFHHSVERERGKEMHDARESGSVNVLEFCTCLPLWFAPEWFFLQGS